MIENWKLCKKMVSEVVCILGLLATSERCVVYILNSKHEGGGLKVSESVNFRFEEFYIIR